MAHLIPPYSPLSTSDPDLSRAQDAIERVLVPLSKLETLDARLVRGVVLVAGVTNRVSHGLGRKVVGWYVSRKRVTCDVWEDPTEDKAPTLLLALHTSANATVDIVVF